MSDKGAPLEGQRGIKDGMPAHGRQLVPALRLEQPGDYLAWIRLVQGGRNTAQVVHRPRRTQRRERHRPGARLGRAHNHARKLLKQLAPLLTRLLGVLRRKLAADEVWRWAGAVQLRHVAAESSRQHQRRLTDVGRVAHQASNERARVYIGQ